MICPSIVKLLAPKSVIDVGCGLKDRPMVIKKGATVFYVFGAGTKIEDNGEEFLVMRDTDCLLQIFENGTE